MPLFGARTYVGLDLGSHTIKAVEMARGPQGMRILRAGSAPTPPGAIKDGIATDPEILGAAIRDLLNQLRIQPRRVITDIGGQAVIVREIKLPEMTREEVAQAVKFEAERYIPYGVKDMVVDFDIVGEVLEGGQRRLLVLLVAARRELVDKQLKALEVAGVHPEILDVEAFAVLRGLRGAPAPQVPDGEALVYVDIGADATDILVTEGESLRLMRNVSTGGNNLTRAISLAMDLDFGAAEELKVKKGTLLPEEVEGDRTARELYDIVLPHLMDIAAEIRRSVDYFQTRFQKTRMGKVFLSGGTARLKGIDRFLATELGLEVVVGDPFQGCTYDERTFPEEERRLSGPAMAAAIGLARRGAEEL